MQGQKRQATDDLYRAIRRFRVDGILTPELRRLFAERRKRLGLSRSRLARFIKTSAQTIMFWESGRTRRCSVRHREVIITVITGALHNLLAPLKPVPPPLAPKIPGFRQLQAATYPEPETPGPHHSRTLFSIWRFMG